VYTPVEQRLHGYYVLPILFADRLVGRIEPRFSREHSRLDVVGLWFERGFDPETPGFVDAFGETLRAFAAFVGAKVTKLGRGKICRWIAVRL
ncbi:cytoplasmic protein, partial [Pseudomonas sp. GW456-11-11-14-TSB2]